MSLYDDTNPNHLAYLERHRAAGRAYTLSRRGVPGFCSGCGWSRDDDQPCRNGECPTQQEEAA